MNKQPILSRNESLIKRFWSYVNIEGLLDCWNWTGAKNHWGYGMIGLGKRTDGTERAHRVSWSLVYGGIPDGMCILHKCDNPACVNPSHLFLGTPLDNEKDMRAKGRGKNPPIFIGINNPETHFTEEDIICIRILAQQEISFRQIGRMYNVGHSTISNIVNCRTWKHI